MGLRPRSLSTVLLAWTLPVILAAVTAIAAASYSIARRAVLAEIEQGTRSFAEVAAAQAKAFFEQRRNDLATISQSPLFRDHYMNLEYGLSQEAEMRRGEVERMLRDFARRTRVYPEILYLDARGRVLCRVREASAGPPLSGLERDPGFAARLASLRPGQRVEALIEDGPQGFAGLRCAEGLFDEAGERRGALVFAASLEPLYALLERMRLGRSGRVSLVERGRRGGRASGDLVTASAAVPGTPWAVLSVADRSESLVRLQGINAATLLIVLATAAVLILVLTREVNLLLKPVAALADAAGAYARGQLGVRVKVEPPREVAALAESFNSMAEGLQQRTEAITLSEARYRTAIENSPHAVVSLDRDFRVTLWNRRAEGLFGYAAAEVEGRSLALVLGEAQETLRREAEAAGAVREREVRGRGRDGRSLDLQVSWTGQDGQGGRPREWFVVIQDMTEKNRLQCQLLQAEKMSAVGNLVAGIAHELNNPLAAVTGFAELLKDLPVRPEEKEDLRHMHASAMRCRDIVQGLLLFARPGERSPRRRLSLNRIVQATLALMEYRIVKTEGIRLSVDLDRGQPEIAAEFQKVQQVLVNLLCNACDALKERREPRLIRVRTLAGAEGPEAMVEDTGPGVPCEQRQRVLEPFFTTKPEGAGTGLGLSISAQIMAEFGGTLRCGQGPEGGARFTAVFPPCPAVLPEEERAQPLPPAVSGRRVLVVDDEPELSELMTRLLVEDGLSAEAAAGVEEAAARIEGGGWDLVITDMDMGELKGTDLIEASRTNERPPLFILVTGDVLNRSRAQELYEWKVPVLAKPFLRTEFLRLVRRTLAQ